MKVLLSATMLKTNDLPAERWPYEPLAALELLDGV